MNTGISGSQISESGQRIGSFLQAGSGQVSGCCLEQEGEKKMRGRESRETGGGDEQDGRV